MSLCGSPRDAREISLGAARACGPGEVFILDAGPAFAGAELSRIAGGSSGDRLQLREGDQAWSCCSRRDQRHGKGKITENEAAPAAVCFARARTQVRSQNRGGADAGKGRKRIRGDRWAKPALDEPE